MRQVALSFGILAILLMGCATADIRIPSASNVEKYDTTLVGQVRKPEGTGQFPAVIFMHGCSGLDSASMAGLDAHAQHFLEQGYATLILDSFGPRGKGDICYDDDEEGAALYYRVFDAFHALTYLQNQTYVDAQNVYLVGLSNGGSAALRVASGTGGHTALKGYFGDAARFRAIVAYYPYCEALYTEIISPLLVFGAGKDNRNEPSLCKLTADHNTVSGAPYKVVIYPEAYHGFDLPIRVRNNAGYVVGGNPDATRNSRIEMTQWFRRFRVGK